MTETLRYAVIGTALLLSVGLTSCGAASGQGSSLTPAPSTSTPVTSTPTAAASTPTPAGSTPRVSASRGHQAHRLWKATGKFRRAGGGSERFGKGRPRRYMVKVETGVDVRPSRFARFVDATLGDRRSWIAEGYAYKRVHRGHVDFRVLLAAPKTVNRLCAPLRTNGDLSCAAGNRAVLNAKRWLRGAREYRGDRTGYRTYLVNHEVGHLLGHKHRQCPRKGALAPVMMQQTISIGACRKNPWPHPHR